jgi:hypothetical protein
MTNFVVTTFWTPKAGHSTDEYEDAFAADPEQGRFAIADGASETSFARQWARLLVDGFVERPPEEGRLREWLAPMQAQWQQEIGTRSMAWYAEEKARDGAFAAFLGLTLEAARWRAVAVGDACLFILREQRVAVAAPMSESKQFTNRPVLLSSVARANGRALESVFTDDGRLQPGDHVLLMTDALAAWFCEEMELDRRPWAALARAHTNEEFASFVAFLRSGGAMKNDDATLVRVEVP